MKPSWNRWGWSLLIAGFSLGAISCATYTDETQKIRGLYGSGQYDSALKDLEESDIKSSSRNQLLYHLEKAMILDRLGDRQKSRNHFMEADRIADNLYTVSATKTAASFVVNEASTDYSGEDFERVAIHTMLALSFIEDRNYNSALVEARKINTKLIEINNKYEEKKNQYGEDAFARYLAGLVYDVKGELDSAIIDYTKAINLYHGSYRQFSPAGVAKGLIWRLYELLSWRGRANRLKELEQQFPKEVGAIKAEIDRQPDFGYLAVVHEVGSIVTKTEKDFIVPFGKQVIRFSWPTYRPLRRYFGNTGVRLTGDGSLLRAEDVQDMDQIARVTLEDRRLRMVLKQGARLLVKGQLTEQAYRNFGPVGGIAANVFSAVTESADTRSWNLLPSSFQVTHIRMKPGKYDLRIYTDGKLTSIKSVDIEPRRTTLLRDIGR